MPISLRVPLPLLLALVVAGCGDYLSAPDATADPTKVTQLTKPGPLYVGIQQSGPPQREVAIAVMYTQQVADVSGGGGDRYETPPSAMDGLFSAMYGGGGLLDIHKMQQIARATHDALYVGVGKVYEALQVGYAADVWGDIPYREAADSNILQPMFDPQLQVYADIQTQLDSAITLYLSSTDPSTLGHDKSELIYGGRESELPHLYTEVAHSLKARYYMHVAATDPAGYQKAFHEAQLGIGSPTDDFLWFHSDTPAGQNLWWQLNASGASSIAPGAAMIQILLRRIGAGVEDSSRLQFYFTLATGGGYFGYRPTGDKLLPNGGGSPTGNYSGFGPFIDGTSGPPDFQQPELTYAEMQLIMAEAEWHLACPGCVASTVVPQAQPFLDAARKNRRYGALGGAPITFPDLGTVPASLQNIMEEKYVTLFLNPEVWNDYKRTCLPSLAPAPPSVKSVTPGTAPIPGRLPYSQAEMNANPNTPKVSSVGLNPNQPKACPVLNYTSSSPLAN